MNAKKRWEQTELFPDPPKRPGRGPYDNLPDVRDGLTRIERIVLYVLHRTQEERGGRNVPTAMLYGRVVEYVDISVDELQRVLQRLALDGRTRGN
ncbi:hypothetical protein [Polyangium aurulentum]|uniref:hypothetical protein n=1 Tax=Polyangium aurulentum TaxID=2567896 RepID=UPI001F1B034D|nr:hypothetical protein [Polyangium aurulentum]